MMKYAEVAVDAPAGYNRTFTYSIPSGIGLSSGHLVRVPFGPRLVPGVVFGLSNESQVSETREIQGLLHPQPILHPHQLVLGRWMSHYYMASLFDCASLMMPPGFSVRARSYLSPTPSGHELKLTPSQARVMVYITSAGRVERGALVRALGSGVEAVVNALVHLGAIEVTWQWQRPRVSPRYVSYLELAVSPGDAEGRAACLGARAPRQAALLRYMANLHVPVPLATVQHQFGSSATRALQSKNLLLRTRLRLQRDPLGGRVFSPDTPPILTAEQRACVSAVEDAIDSNVSQVFLLHGVTGSGKTEVYLHALAHTLSNGKRAIVMVPEISLTPQTIERFGHRFPGQVAVLHSGLSPGEHFDQWWRIREGDYGVVIGSRSAVFAPQPDLGLIVVDEEHEWTYKQQDAPPLYHAREVALKLAELTGAVVILGSATPDVVSYNDALRHKHRLLELPHRIVTSSDPGPPHSVALPHVRVVDLRRELREGNRSIFSRSLQSGMTRALQAGEQVILYLNRRGSGSLVQCRDCGHVLKCRRCDLPLTYHGQAERLLCHHCNYRLIPPRACPGCHGPRIRYLGLGTQRVVEEVQHAFPGTSVLRWDRDAASARDAHRRTMEAFLQGDAQVLVGTQMIAKGLHFPNVTLVGVLCADIGLFLPDFRAGERVFQLLCQVAGRAGRGPLGGQVVIQTYSPHNYAVAAAATQDYAAFFKGEMAYRRELQVPPVGRLIRLLYLHTNQGRCQQEAVRLVGALKAARDRWGLTNEDIVGPAPAFPPRIRGRFRWHIILRSGDPRALLDKVPIPRGWIVDVDPQSVT
ncbi:MAG: primosomal protein N' [Chloroflexi bacterium]|nr:primosomal protein N' [Chloroflexota bacterium]